MFLSVEKYELNVNGDGYKFGTRDKSQSTEWLWSDWVRMENLFNEIQNIFIINKLNVTPINLLFFVFFLLHFENMLQIKYFKYHEHV